MALQEDVSVGILLHSPQFDLHPCVFAGTKDAGDEGASAGAYHSNDDVTGRTGHRFTSLGPIDDGLSDRLFVEIVFDRVLFKDFVGHALEVVSEGLEWTLEVILITGAELFEDGARWLFAPEVADVAELWVGVFKGFAAALLLLLVVLLELGGSGWGWEGSSIA